MAKPVTKRGRNQIDAFVIGQAVKCSFCGGPSSSSYSAFNFFTRDLKHLVCSNCVERFAVIQRIERIRLMAFSQGEFDRLRHLLNRSLATERASERMKKIAVDLAIVLVYQSYRIFKASECGENPPAPKRFFVRDGDMGRFRALLARACEQVGIMVLVTTIENFERGHAAKRTLEVYCRDPLLEIHCVLFVRDGEPRGPSRNTMVCVSKNDKAVSLTGNIP